MLAVNENPVVDAQKVSAYLQSLSPGSIVSMKILREGAELVIDLQLPGNPAGK
ncbi:MAG: hypothetical protein P8Z37_14010 [Acidobacteriota bacterium]